MTALGVFFAIGSLVMAGVIIYLLFIKPKQKQG